MTLLQSQYSSRACRRAVPIIFFASIAICIGGCTFGPCNSTPLVLLPLYAPLGLMTQEPEDHSPAGFNANFVLAGQVVDDRGAAVDSVEAEIISWVAIHRKSDSVDQWEQRARHAALGSRFRLNINQAQAADIVFRRSGYHEQHLVVAYGAGRPPNVHIRSDRYQSWNKSMPGPPTDVAELDDGGVFYQAYRGDPWVRKQDLRIVMTRSGIYQGVLSDYVRVPCCGNAR